MFAQCGLPYTVKPVKIGRGDQFKANSMHCRRHEFAPLLVACFEFL